MGIGAFFSGHFGSIQYSGGLTEVPQCGRPRPVGDEKAGQTLFLMRKLFI